MSETNTYVYKYTCDTPVPWNRPYTYDEWKAIVLVEGRSADEEMLQYFYGLTWDPVDCTEMMLTDKLYTKAKKLRVVIMDQERVNRRIAVALWKECARLLMRRLTPDARAMVIALQEQAEVTGGLPKA